MPITYTPIATSTLSAAAANIEFTSISGTYTDLVLVTSVKYASGEQALGLTFNNDTGTNYSATYVYGNGTVATSSRDTNNTAIPVARGDASQFCGGVTNIFDYSNTSKFKTIISRGSSGTYVISYTGLWRNASAITSLKVATLTGTNFAVDSTFTLYGIKAA
jgi:hypothetical protein